MLIAGSAWEQGIEGGICYKMEGNQRNDSRSGEGEGARSQDLL